MAILAVEVANSSSITCHRSTKTRARAKAETTDISLQVPNRATAPEVAPLFLRVNTTGVFFGEASGKSLSRFLWEKKAKRMEDFLLEPSLLSIQVSNFIDHGHFLTDT